MSNPEEIPLAWVKVSHHTPRHMTRYPYAAYGSNLLFTQIATRCPDSDIVGAGKLHGAKLRFAHVATIVESARHFVPVGIFKLSERDIAALDMREGMGRVYDRFLVTVETDGRMLRCFTYIKRASYEEAPSDEYYSRVARGYKDWSFPDRRLRRARNSAIEATRAWRNGKITSHAQFEPIAEDTMTAWERYKRADVSADLDRLRQGTRPTYVAREDKLSSSSALPVVHKPAPLPDRPEQLFYNQEKRELWGLYGRVWKRMRSFRVPRGSIPEGLVREPDDVRLSVDGTLDGLFNGEWRKLP